jgi:hypothetical protein
MYQKKRRRETQLPKGLTEDLENLIAKTAEQVGVPSIVVKDIVDHCFSEVRD